MKLIVAVDRNWGIGRGNGLLFRLPADMRRFRETTLGKTVVMGKNTLLSFPGGKPLKDRRNIVLSSGYTGEGVTVAENIQRLCELLKDVPSDEQIVIGGGAVYRALLPYCDTAYVTKVDADGGAEIFFANLDETPGWRLTDAGEPMRDGGFTIRFAEYRNAAALPLISE